METGYQRGKIQEESLYYEHKKHDGSYPLIGVNTFLNPKGSGVASEIELARSTEEEKQSQLTRLADFQTRNAGQSAEWLAKLKQAVIDNRNVFEVMMGAVRHCSLGQISNTLYDVGGQYRRSM
jgi:methylmalonyl-CoA mutase